MRLHRCCAGVPGWLLAWAYFVAGQALPAQQPPAPLQAALTQTLDARALHVGDDVLLTTLREWSYESCHLAPGAAVHGRVVALQSGSGSRHESVSMAFDSPCADEQRHKLFWIALLEPETSTMKGVTDDPMRLRSLRSPSFGQGGGLGSSGNSQANHVDLSGRQNPSLPPFTDTTDDEKEKRPQAIKTGQVWGLTGIALKVDQDSTHSTLVESKGTRLRVPARSVFVLLDERAAFKAEKTRLVAVTESSPSVPPKALSGVSALSPCRAPMCLLVDVSNDQAATSRQRFVMPLDRMGFRPRRTAALMDLEFNSAVAFLGDRQVLVTFNSGALVQRDQTERPEDHPHSVRALSVDISTGKVLGKADWRINDARQYLWPLSGGRALVHLHQSLVWFGPGLQKEKELTLAGPLAFLRVAPDGHHILLGVIREMHSKEEHGKLLDLSAGPPEERVQIRVLDDSLSVLDEVEQSSTRMPPVLLTDGTVEVRHLEKDQFFLQSQGWGRTTHRNFARVTSSCVPKLRSFSRDLLMLETCNAQRLENTFRVLRADGEPLLAGSVQWRQFSPLLEGDAHQKMFALTTVEGDTHFVRDTLFHSSDLKKEVIAIFDAESGRPVTSVRLRVPGAGNQPIALSPDGDALALLDGTNLIVYDIEHESTTVTASSSQN